MQKQVHSDALPVVCLHEDRPDYLVGVKLAVASLARHAPQLRVIVSCPNANAEFVDWVRAQPNAEVRVLRHLRGAGFNVKPSVLLELLESHRSVVWIDSDIIISGNVDKWFAPYTDHLLATEETYWGQQQGGDFRTSAWGLEPARSMTCTVNSGVVQVTREHVPLLRDWQTMLAHPSYLKAQSRPWYERPVHMIGDQEALTGLLGSSEFSQLPITLLKRGTDIAQCFGPAGFTPMERIHALAGRGPSFIHAMGPKPWLRPAKPVRIVPSKNKSTTLRDWYTYLALDVSPYCVEARSYAGKPGVDVGWAWPRSVLGKILCAVGGNHPAAPGLPLAVIDHFARWLKRVLGVGRYSNNAEYTLTQRPF